jgi:hypothetical protein
MVIFGAGVVTGGLLVQHAGGSRVRRAVEKGTEAAPNRPSAYDLRLDFLRRVRPELQLTPEQGDRIDKLLRESQADIADIRAWAEADVVEDLQWTKDEFRKVLTPDQRTRFDELLKRPPRTRGPYRAGTPTKGPTNSTSSTSTTPPS